MAFWKRKRKRKRPPLRAVHQTERYSHFNGEGRPLHGTSGRSERTGEFDEGALRPGRGEPEAEPERPARNRENPAPASAEAENADAGRGEFSEQREGVSPQHRLGFPQHQGPR